MGLCVAMIAFVRLPSLKVSCLLLSGLLIYDVFWVSVYFLFSSDLVEVVAAQSCLNLQSLACGQSEVIDSLWCGAQVSVMYGHHGTVCW